MGVEERKKKGKKSKEEFSPEPDTITGAPPVEERKKKSKKSKEEFSPEPDTITGAPPAEERAPPKEFSPAPPAEERAPPKEFSPAPPVEERKKKGKKSKEEFSPELRLRHPRRDCTREGGSRSIRRSRTRRSRP